MLPTLSSVAHTSPTDGLTPNVRKGRVYALLAHEAAPAEIWPLRCALAEALGMREWLDPKTKDPSRIYFAGRLQGTPPRDFYAFEGETLHPAELLAAFPHAARPTPPNDDEQSGVHERTPYEPGDRDDAIVALLAPHLEQPGNRHATALALGAALKKSGLGWSDGEIERVVRALPSEDPDARARDALGAAGRAQRGGLSGNWSSLVELGFPTHVVRACEALANETLTLAANTLNVQANAAQPAQAAQPTNDEPFQVANIYAPLVEPNWLCEMLCVAPGAPTLLAGKGGVGKTMLWQLLAICVATGRPFLGMPVRKARVLHYDNEQGRNVTQRRYQRLAAGLGLDAGALGDLHIVCAPRLTLTTPGWEDELRRRVEGFGFWFGDSLRALCPALDENDSRIREPLDGLQRISEATGCVMSLLHHRNKSTGGDGSDKMRGSTAINDAAQTVIMLEPATRGFNVAAGKVRDGQPFTPFGVEIRNTELGERAPFAGLELAIIDGVRRAKADKAAVFADDCETILALGRAAPGGILPGRAMLAETTGLSERRVRAVLEALEQDRRIITDSSGKKVVCA
jgi:hypothetical protein